ncbi:MAG: DNA translocase FtsK [Fimbriiglobus sp.]
MTELPPETKSRFRWDAVACASGMLLLSLGVAIVNDPAMFGLSNIVGPAAIQVSRPLADAAGYGVVVGVVGLLIVVAGYVLGHSHARLVLRTSGWVLLAVVVSLAADRWLLGEGPAVSAYGRGGAIGAWGHIRLQQAVNDPLPTVMLAALAFLGLVLVAEKSVKFVLDQLSQILLGIVSKIARAIQERLLRARHYREARRAAASIPVPTLTPAPVAQESSPPPIIRHTALPSTNAADDTPLYTPAVRVPTPLPISRITPPSPPSRASQSLDDTVPLHSGYEMPSLSLLSDSVAIPVEDHEQQLRDRAALLEKTFTDFGLTVKVVGIHTGPVITQYEIALETGLRLNKVTTLSDDLALCLKVPAVRIVAPLPGRNTVGIEVPNEHRQTVRLKELVQSTTAQASKLKLPIFLGKDVEGRPLVYDMAAMPHLLIAGRTGTGKSVCLNSIILSFLYTCRPDQCRMIMIDPKKVELSEYGKIPHLMHPVVTDDKKAEAILAWAVDKMEERYELMRKARVRNLASYNELGRDEIIRRVDPANEDERAAIPAQMPYIVIIVDEVGDLLMSMKKEVEGHIIRLAQKSRAAGIHLILATQKPTVDVITGLIKSNLPARICFQVATRADSAVVLDEKGADKLLGMGDMLFLQPGTSTIIRAQGAYVDDREIERTVASMEVYEPNFESELLNLKAKDDTGGSNIGEKLRERDPLYEQAVEIVIREQRGSTSLLQRALGIGYGKASRFIDWMAEDGIVGSYNGSNARDVLVNAEEWEFRKQT